MLCASVLSEKVNVKSEENVRGTECDFSCEIRSCGVEIEIVGLCEIALGRHSERCSTGGRREGCRPNSALGWSASAATQIDAGRVAIDRLH